MKVGCKQNLIAECVAHAAGTERADRVGRVSWRELAGAGRRAVGFEQLKIASGGGGPEICLVADALISTARGAICERLLTAEGLGKLVGPLGLEPRTKGL